jgi:AraC-like DNA-binding protein
MLFSITILGFVITFLLLINLRQSNKVNIYLFFFLIINNIYAFSHYATVYSGNKYLIAIMLVHFTPLYLLLGPLFYFYIRGLLTDDHQLTKYDWIHFIPAVLFFINIQPYFLNGWAFKLQYAENVIKDVNSFINIDYIFLPPKFSFLTRPLFAIVYVIASIILIYKRGIKESYLTDQVKLIYRWIILLVTTSVILYLGFLLFSVLSILINSFTLAENKGFIFLYATVIGLLILNLSLLFFPNILYGLPQFDYVIVTKKNREGQQRLGIVEDVKKQSKSFEISSEKLDLLKLKIERYIESKPYLNPDFNLTMMSSDINIPVHHLSYYFNEHLNIGFNTWKNNFKIDHVITLINNGAGEILTLDALAKQAGFGSRTSFFNSFKQKIGVTPSEYLNSLD